MRAVNIGIGICFFGSIFLMIVGLIMDAGASAERKKKREAEKLEEAFQEKCREEKYLRELDNRIFQLEHPVKA